MEMVQLNRAVIRGIVGNVRLTTVGDTKVARMTVATNYAYKAKDGSCILETQWHTAVLFEGHGITGLEEVSKGDKVHIEGRIRNQRYTGADGIERTSTEILAQKFERIVSDEPLRMEV